MCALCVLEGGWVRRSQTSRMAGIDWANLHLLTPPRLEAFLPALRPDDKPLHEHDVSRKGTHAEENGTCRTRVTRPCCRPGRMSSRILRPPSTSATWASLRYPCPTARTTRAGPHALVAPLQVISAQDKERQQKLEQQAKDSPWWVGDSRGRALGCRLGRDTFPCSSFPFFTCGWYRSGKSFSTQASSLSRPAS
jgi:hypothetical protein